MMRDGEPGEKNSRSSVENQQTPPVTHDGGSGNRTRVTLVEGERSHHCICILQVMQNVSDPCMGLIPRRTTLHMRNTQHASQINSGYYWAMSRHNRKQLFAAFNKHISVYVFFFYLSFFLYEKLDKSNKFIRWS